jgi:hypothetical protein
MSFLKNRITSASSSGRRRRSIRRRLLAACAAFFVLTSCAGSPKRFAARDVDFSAIRKIAVLPLENFTANQYSGEKIRSIVNVEFLSRGIEAVEPGEVTKALSDMKIKSLRLLSAEDFKKMADLLGADALIAGSVNSYEISQGIAASYPEVSIQLASYGASTGKIIWSAWHTSGGASFGTRHFGTEGMTLSEAAEKVVRESIESFLPGK